MATAPSDEDTVQLDSYLNPATDTTLWQLKVTWHSLIPCSGGIEADVVIPVCAESVRAPSSRLECLSAFDELCRAVLGSVDCMALA
jgi:hypothetical protein